MQKILEADVVYVGSNVQKFLDERIMLVFGNESVNDAVREYSFLIEKVSLSSQIRKGHILKLNDEEYKITSVGTIVDENLSTIHHITLKFNNSVVAEFPGTLYLEDKPVKKLSAGDKLTIIEK